MKIKTQKLFRVRLEFDDKDQDLKDNFKAFASSNNISYVFLSKVNNNVIDCAFDKENYDMVCEHLKSQPIQPEYKDGTLSKYIRRIGPVMMLFLCLTLASCQRTTVTIAPVENTYHHIELELLNPPKLDTIYIK